MYLILNKYAAGGTAEKKWESIKNFINQRFDNINIVDVSKHIALENVITEAIVKGNQDFIIAGGDGTINYFINKLIHAINENDIKKIKIGALGIGSSNDFTKPIMKENLINEIPCKINFDGAKLRDIGVIRYKSGSEILHKYFLLNASLGITAEANNLFNNPDHILNFLKKQFTSLAILYAALKTIFTYKNIEVKIISDQSERNSFSVSNLSIIKSPHFSGDLCYPNEADYQNGLYDIYLTHSMNKLDLIRLLISLGKRIFPENKKTIHSKTPKFIIKSQSNFRVEFDGEIITTNYAECYIQKEYLKICNK
jgi:diacylglycerol kinase (ATP)